MELKEMVANFSQRQFSRIPNPAEDACAPVQQGEWCDQHRICCPPIISDSQKHHHQLVWKTLRAASYGSICCLAWDLHILDPS